MGPKKADKKIVVITKSGRQVKNKHYLGDTSSSENCKTPRKAGKRKIEMPDPPEGQCLFHYIRCFCLLLLQHFIVAIAQLMLLFIVVTTN